MVGLPRCVLGMLSAPSVLPARACVARGGGNWPQRGLGAWFPGAGLGEASQNGLLWVLEDGSALSDVHKGAARKFLECLWQIELGAVENKTAQCVAGSSAET